MKQKKTENITDMINMLSHWFKKLDTHQTDILPVGAGVGGTVSVQGGEFAITLSSSSVSDPAVMSLGSSSTMRKIMREKRSLEGDMTK